MTAALGASAGVPTGRTDDDWANARSHIPGLLGQVLDDHTIDTLTDQALPRLSLRAGWRGLVIGPGVDHVADWLADRVNPDGIVDRRPGDSGYDLVVARTTVAADQDPDHLLTDLATAVRPDGILLIVEWGEIPADALLATSIHCGAQASEAVHQGMRRIPWGGDPDWPHGLPLALRDLGLTRIDATIQTQLWWGGLAGCGLYSAWADAARDELITAGVSDHDLSIHHRAMEDPVTMVRGRTIHTVLGQRPR